MDVTAMQARAWLMLNDDASTPVKLTAANALIYINQAVQDLAPLLRKYKTATLSSFTAGVASWPADFVSPLRILDSTTRLKQIFKLGDAVAATDTTSQWMWVNASQVKIFGSTPAGTVTLHYYATPAALSQGADVPTDIPTRLHHYIPEIYVVAMYHLSQGDPNTYAAFMEIWEEKVKGEVIEAVANWAIEDDETPPASRVVW